MKRLLALLLSILLMAQIVPSVFAQSNAEVTLTSASAMCGENVTITVSVKNCVEAKSIYIVPQYDEEVLEIVSGTWLISGMLADDWSAEFGDAAIAFSANTDVNTDVFEFVFKVKDNAQAGAVATVSCEIVIKTMEGKDEVPVTVTITEGRVTVLAKQCSHTSKTEVPSKSADCVNSGNNLYFVCNSCGLAFKADGVTETTVEAETIPALGHDLTDATCTEAAKCKREGCGHVEGTALGHSFANYISNNDASCEADGTKTAKCDRCDATDTVTDVGSSKGHDYTDATCSAPKTCKVCSATEGDPLGHSFTNYVSNNDATCTEDGTKTAKCDRCNVTDTVTDAGSAKGHDYADATCTTPKTCKVCGTTEGESLGHSFTNYVSNNDATCTTDGTKTAKCDRCNVTDTIADAGSSKGHNYATTWSKGEDGHWHECGTCGDKTDFAVHDYGNQGDKCVICEYERTHVHRLTLVPAADATCTETGNKAYYTCSGCENWFEDASGSVMILDKTTVIISAMGHDLSDSTCTEAAKCQREGCGHVEGTALGHSFTNYVPNNDATCTEDGTKTAKCDRCDVTDTITDVGSAKGHDYADATCTAPKTCKACGATEGNPLGHSYATTWSKGEDGHWHECSACGDKTDFSAHDYGTTGDICLVCEYERAHIHRLTLTPAVEATCTTDGNVAYYTCSGCENWFEDASGSVVIADKTSVVVEALGHDLTDATCTEVPHCKREGCEYSEGSALGHSFTNYVSNNDATCTEDGTKTAKCDCCDETDTITDVGSAKGHDYADATCTTPKTCKVCGAAEGDPLGHDIVEATCTEAAYCQREGCDYTEGTALGHVDENADNKCDECGASMGGGQPTTPDKPTDDVPQTGDISKPMLWAVVLMLSIAGTIICVLFSKKKNAA